MPHDAQIKQHKFHQVIHCGDSQSQMKISDFSEQLSFMCSKDGERTRMIGPDSPCNTSLSVAARLLGQQKERGQ